MKDPIKETEEFHQEPGPINQKEPWSEQMPSQFSVRWGDKWDDQNL